MGKICIYHLSKTKDIIIHLLKIYKLIHQMAFEPDFAFGFFAIYLLHKGGQFREPKRSLS